MEENILFFDQNKQEYAIRYRLPGFLSAETRYFRILRFALMFAESIYETSRIRIASRI